MTDSVPHQVELDLCKALGVDPDETAAILCLPNRIEITLYHLEQGHKHIDPLTGEVATILRIVKVSHD